MKLTRLWAPALISALAIMTLYAAPSAEAQNQTPIQTRGGFTDCYNVAKYLFIYDADAVRACRTADDDFLPCYEIAKPIFFDPLDAVRLCADVKRGFLDCFSVAKNVFYTEIAALKACKDARDNFKECYAIAEGAFLDPVDAVRTCANTGGRHASEILDEIIGKTPESQNAGEVIPGIPGPRPRVD
jgi:hypothetical protein